MDVRKIYQHALKREQEGLEFFASKAEQMHHAAARKVFLDLAEEERRHVLFVQHLLDALDGRLSESAPEADRAGFFEDRAARELLDQSIIEAMVPDVAVLRVAWLIERDIAEFYEANAARATGEAQQALASLARWERGHEALFKTVHDKVEAHYASMPWGG